MPGAGNFGKPRPRERRPYPVAVLGQNIGAVGPGQKECRTGEFAANIRKSKNVLHLAGKNVQVQPPAFFTQVQRFARLFGVQPMPGAGNFAAKRRAPEPGEFARPAPDRPGAAWSPPPGQARASRQSEQVVDLYANRQPVQCPQRSPFEPDRGPKGQPPSLPCRPWNGPIDRRQVPIHPTGRRPDRGKNGCRATGWPRDFACPLPPPARAPTAGLHSPPSSAPIQTAHARSAGQARCRRWKCRFWQAPCPSHIDVKRDPPTLRDVENSGEVGHASVRVYRPLWVSCWGCLPYGLYV